MPGYQNSSILTGPDGGHAGFLHGVSHTLGRRLVVVWRFRIGLGVKEFVNQRHVSKLDPPRRGPNPRRLAHTSPFLRQKPEPVRPLCSLECVLREAHIESSVDDDASDWDHLSSFFFVRPNPNEVTTFRTMLTNWCFWS